MACWASRQVERSSVSDSRKLTNIRKHSQSKSDSRQCTAQTDVPAKASAAVRRWSVEPAMTSPEAPDRPAIWQSPVPHDISLSPESPSHSRPVHRQFYMQPLQDNLLDCKVCRESDAFCDHSRPQCSHCYQQQTLCFYVTPGQKSKSKAEIWSWLEQTSRK